MERREKMIRSALVHPTEPAWALAREVLCRTEPGLGDPDLVESLCLRAIAFRRSNMRRAEKLGAGN
jgi:hypothetical protein